MYLDRNHYLMSQDTNKALFGPISCGEVVDIINAMPKDEAIKYYNASRYQLAKLNLYPRTKAGDASLSADVASSGVVPEIQPHHSMYGN